jgi:hypothetical protein
MVAPRQVSRVASVIRTQCLAAAVLHELISRRSASQNVEAKLRLADA